MYQSPQLMKCPTCHSEHQYSPDHTGAPTNQVPKIKGYPICPSCWEKFLMENFSMLEYVIPEFRKHQKNVTGI